MGVNDTATGVILNIPQSVLNKINEADTAIKKLRDTSEKAAKQVSEHWGNVAATGLDTFIRKLTDARQQMSQMGDVKIGINTTQVKPKMDEAVNTVRKAATDINTELQKASSVGWDKISKVSLKGFDITSYGNNLTEVMANLTNLKQALQNSTFSGKNQALVDEIRQIEEYIRLYKLAQQEKNKALSQVQAKDDKVILDEQKRRLNEILDLKKQVNTQAVKVTSGRITGSSTHEKDVADLRVLVAKLLEAKKAYTDFNTAKSADLSKAGKDAARINALNQENALLKEQMNQREKVNTAIARGNELTAATQANKARLGNNNESIAQRQLNTDYKEMLKIIREQGELKAKVAVQGRDFNQQEIQLIATLAQRYKVYYDDVKRIAVAYANMATASSQAFQNDKSAELQRNAVLLAAAREKAANEAKKEADITAQQNRATAERDLNRLYTERLRLLKEKEQLENKALLNSAKGIPELTKGENRLLNEITSKIQRIDGQIKTIGNTYAGLAAKTKHAFALDELQQATKLQNQFNRALDGVNAAKAKELTAEYRHLDAEFEKLTARLNQFYHANANGTARKSQVDAANAVSRQRNEVSMRMYQLERENIQGIINYRTQKEAEANQLTITKFIEAEAQKTAIAREEAAKQSRARAEAYQKYMNSYDGAMRAYNKLGIGTRKDYADTYENRARMIKQLENALKSLSLTDSDYTAKVEKLKSALLALGVKQREVNAILKQQPKMTIGDARNLINIANTTRSLNDLRSAYNAIMAVMASIPSSSNAFKQLQRDAQNVKTQIDNIQKAMGNFNGQVQQASSSMGALGSRIAAAFSVAAVTNFAKKVTETRAQFELQRVALSAIIQDTDQANRIFTRIQQMALESPFTIMGLEKATKQIAAFGFETNKLVPTMKMFADIAAGLGVEIDRLVLVMGHLKARNFLEGTMVRQFTNMGFNILGNLANYYTEIEGKLISVGEVQDRVKKKMVSFEDVEEVLKRVTSAGGMFYDMQKKQSDSIWGQMQRITDAYDLMLNEIGQSNEGSIKWALSTIRSLITHWRDLKPVIVGAVAAMGTYMAVAVGYKVIRNILLGINLAYLKLTRQTQAAAIAQQELNITTMSNPYAALAGAIIGIVVALGDWLFANDEIEEGLERVAQEGAKQMSDLIFQYKQLAKTIKDVTTPYDEYKEALDTLHRVYKDILPDKMLEVEYIKQTTDGYREATDAIAAYSATKTRENMKEEVDHLVGDDMSEAISNSSKLLSTFLTGGALGIDQILIKDFDEKTVQGAIRNIMTQMFEEVKAGEREWQDYATEFKKRIEDTFDIQIPINDNELNNWVNLALKDVILQLNRVEEAYGKITDIGISQNAKSMEGLPIKEGFAEIDEAVNNYKNALHSLMDLSDEERKTAIANINAIIEKGLSLSEIYSKISQGGFGDKNINRNIYSIIESLNKLKGWGFTPSQIKEEDVDSMIGFTKACNDVDRSVEQLYKDVDPLLDKFGMFINKIGNKSVKIERFNHTIKNTNSYVASLIESVQQAAKEKGLSETGKEIVEIMEKVATANNISRSVFDQLKIDSKTTYESMAKDVKNLITTNKEAIASIKQQSKELTLLGWATDKAKSVAEKAFGIGKSKEELEAETKALQQLYLALGGVDDSNKQRHGRQEDVVLKKWQDIKKLIEDTAKAYENYRKSFQANEANIKILELYDGAFKELGVNMNQFYKDGKYGAENLKKALETLLSMTQANTKDRKKFRSELQRSISDTQIEIEIKLKEGEEKKFKEDIDNIFANYELTKEFADLGINADLTYMVGGKPMTFEQVNKELARLRDAATDGGLTEAAINKLKELESAEKKITQILFKEQKGRITNYKKYLTQMYSANAQTMIKSYATMSQMEKDFNGYINQLNEELLNPKTTDKRRAQLTKLIAVLRNQAKEAILGVQNELSQNMAKANWERFKGSDIFSSMYQDVSSLTKGAIDKLVAKLKTIRESLKNMAEIDPKAIREVTQYIEKLEDAKVELAPYESFRKAISAVKILNENYGSIEAAQKKLVEYNTDIANYDQQVSDLETLIELQNRDVNIKKDGTDESERLLALQKKYNGNYQEALLKARGNLSTTTTNANILKGQLDTAAKLEKSYQRQIDRANQWKEQIVSLTDSVFGLMDAFGLDIDDNWKQLANTIINAVVQAVTLQLQLQILTAQATAFGVAMNAALGIIGWIAIAMSAVVGIFSAIFGIKDNSLQKQIEKLQDEVDELSDAFDHLEKSMDKAFNNAEYQSLFESAKSNINEQKHLYKEMIRLEEDKKKTDDEKLKEYKDKLKELENAEQELYEKRHEKYGSTNDVWDEANNWVDAWLDAYKENGDGLASLNESWEEFYENLVKKQATSRILGQRMDKFIKEINDAIDKNLSNEYSYVDYYKQIGERFKTEFAAANEELKKLFEYAGIGINSDLLLSDLQQGIQNITEPQAAAIEAYLNSMRFAVYRHTEQLDTLIASIQAQYGTGENNPVVTELRGIRAVLNNIYGTLKSVVATRTFGGSSLRITG